MGNINSRMRKKAYKFLKSTTGAFCKMCQIHESEKELVIDHIDNNNSNNNPSNWQFLCRKCNYIKNPRLAEREPLDSVGVSECVSLNYQTPNEITINREKEPLFRECIEQIISKNIEFEKSDLINSGAERVGISIKTSRRYLDKMCSSAGNYQIIRKDNQNYIKRRNKNSI